MHILVFNKIMVTIQIRKLYKIKCIHLKSVMKERERERERERETDSILTLCFNFALFPVGGCGCLPPVLACDWAGLLLALVAVPRLADGCWVLARAERLLRVDAFDCWLDDIPVEWLWAEPMRVCGGCVLYVRTCVCVCTHGKRECGINHRKARLSSFHGGEQIYKIWRSAQIVVGNEMAIIQLTLGTPTTQSNHLWSSERVNIYVRSSNNTCAWKTAYKSKPVCA